MKRVGLCEHVWTLTGRDLAKALALDLRIDMECELCGLGRYPEAVEIFENECAWNRIVMQAQAVERQFTNSRGDKMADRKSTDDYKRELLEAATDEEADQVVARALAHKEWLGKWLRTWLQRHVWNEKSVLGGIESDPLCVLDRRAITRMQRGMAVCGMVPLDVDKEMEAHRQLVLYYVATAAEWVPVFIATRDGWNHSSTRSWEHAAIEAVRKLQEKRQH